MLNNKRVFILVPSMKCLPPHSCRSFHSQHGAREGSLGHGEIQRGEYVTVLQNQQDRHSQYLHVAALVMQSSHIVHISDTVQLLLVRLMLWDAQRIVFGRFASKSLTVDLMKSHAVKPFPTAKMWLEMLQALTH